MKLALHLLRRHRSLLLLFWAVMYLLLAGMLGSFGIFGRWVIESDQPSTWAMVGNQAPLWFLFVIGIVLASTHLPVFIANGVTRREFSVAAGLFGLATSVVFGLFSSFGYVMEATVYRQINLMPELTHAYPSPTVTGFALSVLGYLGFMLSGFLVGLAFYRLRPWWAIAVIPVAAPALGGGLVLPFVPWQALMVIVALTAVAAYLATVNTPLRARKA